MTLKMKMSDVVKLVANRVEGFIETSEFIEEREKSAYLEDATHLLAESDNGHQATRVAQGLDRIENGTQAFTRYLGQSRKIKDHASYAVIHGRFQQLFQLCSNWLADIAVGANDQYLVTGLGMNRHVENS